MNDGELAGKLEGLSQEVKELAERVEGLEKSMYSPDPLGRDRDEWLRRVREGRHEGSVVPR